MAERLADHNARLADQIMAIIIAQMDNSSSLRLSENIANTNEENLLKVPETENLSFSDSNSPHSRPSGNTYRDKF